MKYLTANSPEIVDLLRAMGVDQNGLQSVVLVIRVGEVVRVVAEYKRELWVSDVRETKHFFEQYDVALRRR